MYKGLVVSCMSAKGPNGWSHGGSLLYGWGSGIFEVVVRPELSTHGLVARGGPCGPAAECMAYRAPGRPI